MSKPREKVQIVVVCEDRVQEVLVRNYLIRIGYNPRKIRYQTAPSGMGSGEQFVRVRYMQELPEYRKRNPLYYRLIALLDADSGTVAEHEAELAAAVVASSQLPRQPTEGVVHLIPKRNVETWIHRLLGNPADELTDYKSRYAKQPENTYCRPTADELVSLVRDVHRKPDLPSLSVAVAELREKLNGNA